MELEATGQATNARDRVLLAHPDGLASTMAFFALVPTADDPRRVLLEVDEPAWGVSGVQIGALGDNGPFAALDGLAGTVLEMVPRGPAEPEQFALRLGDGRWLGIVSAQTEGETVPIWEAAVVDQPAWFDLVRSGNGYQLSYLDPVDGVRKYLYVNEQLVAGADFQVQQTVLPTNLLTVPFDFGTVQSLCPGQASWLSIRGGGDQGTSVTYSVTVNVNHWDQLGGAACFLGPTGTDQDSKFFDARDEVGGYQPAGSHSSISLLLQPGETDYLYCEKTDSAYAQSWPCLDVDSVYLSVQ